jgi:hypothetical protein
MGNVVVPEFEKAAKTQALLPIFDRLGRNDPTLTDLDLSSKKSVEYHTAASVGRNRRWRSPTLEPSLAIQSLSLSLQSICTTIKSEMEGSNT